MPMELEEQAVTITDQETIRRICASGDEAGFIGVLRSIDREAFSYVRNYIGGDEDRARDIMQDASMNALRGFRKGQFDPSQKLRPWYFTLLTHAAIDSSRRNKHWHETLSLDQPGRSSSGEFSDVNLTNLLLSHEPDPATLQEIGDSTLQLYHAIRGLSKKQRAIVQRVYLENAKYHEAAEALDIPVGTVKSQAHAAKAKLRALMEQQAA